MQKVYLAEYSPSQRAFHVHTQAERAASERRAQELMGHPSDYHVLGEFSSHAAALDFIDRNRDSVKQHGFYIDQADCTQFIHQPKTVRL